MAKRTIHFVLSTHWDREWRESFQELRYDLVRLMDRVIAGLQDGRLQGPFQTDGQSIVVEDYLEVRPERRAEIERLASMGKLVVGPWYTMPDEFTVSGESLIRNLRLGRDIARSLGGQPSLAGYVPDMFGHTSQLPQILAGFGVRGAYLWRGVNNIETRNLIWRGADGTELVCHRFGRIGYGTYAFLVRHGHDFGETGYDNMEFTRRLEQYLEDEARATAVDTILVLDSCDHQEWDEPAYALVQGYFAQADCPYDFIHTSLDAYLVELLHQKDRIPTVLTGELREPGRATVQPGQSALDADQQWVIPGVLSSRVGMKQANRASETALCQWAEPFCAFAHVAIGAEYPQGFLDLAWRRLLKNHAHDSIDGCSIDQVHRDMHYHFDQSLLISNRLAKEATHQLAARVQGSIDQNELRVVVFNPAARPFNGVTELTLQIPADWPCFNEFFGFEPKPAFRIYTPDGVEVAYQRLSQAMDRIKTRIRPTKFPDAYRTHDVKVALNVTVSAVGYTTLIVRAASAGQPTRHPDVPGLAKDAITLENEHLWVRVAPDGALALVDRHTDQMYMNLLHYEDSADIGDGWYHGVGVNDQVFSSTGSRCDVALVHNGPLCATLRIRTTMHVPAQFDFARMARSDSFSELVIDSLVTLRAGQPYLDVETTVDNQIDDHRLRVLLSTGVHADHYLADSAFDVVERPIALRADNHLYRELEVETKPQQSWTAVSDPDSGLAIITKGLLESAVRDLPDRPLALTLFRSTRRTALTDGEPDGLMHGKLTFSYRIMPLSGEPDRTCLCELGMQLSAGLRDAQLRSQDIAIYSHRPSTHPETALATSGSLLRLDGDAVMASLRNVDKAVEVRLFNPRDTPIRGALLLDASIHPAWTTAQQVDFESNPAAAAQMIDNGTVLYSLAPKQITTLRLT